MNNPNTPIQEEPKSVHNALNEASLETREKDKAEGMKSFSVRLSDTTRSRAQEICERHGTNLGAYLRKCAEILVDEYSAEDAKESE